MAEVNGKLVSCDRCGDTVFLKCIGEGETDGGFTRWNKFEPLHDGWTYCNGVGRLCPKCTEQFNKMLKNFIQEVRGNVGEQNQR